MLPAAPAARLDAIEATLADLLPRLSPTRPTWGRPEILPGALLWAGLLVCILRGATSQQALWRLLGEVGLWHYPTVPVGAEAVRIRLVRSGPAVLERLFVDVTAALAATLPPALDLAPFASGVYAIDESTLDGVARTLPALRALPSGDDRLLPGKLQTVFDVRAQRFTTVQTTDLPRQNEKVAARDLLATVPSGSLILADLGYFGFPWFDDLTDGGYHYISKLRKKTSYQVVHVLAAANGVRDELVWLGAHRADKAKHLVRLLTVPVGQTVHRYLTTVRDPALLPPTNLVRLYARRWTIEEAFKTLKRELGLHLLWSAQWELILTQLYGVLVIAQIASALRAEIARRAGIDPFDVSLTLLLRELAWFVRRGEPDVLGPIAALPVVPGATCGRRGGRCLIPARSRRRRPTW